MYQALYRKWRPATFDDVVGQDHITSILKYEIAHQKLNHAYLFCGSRGTGKTTCAKILAKAVNCEHPVNGNPCGSCDNCLNIEKNATTDIIEMDAASNNGVDNIRVIREEVTYVPSLLKYRVYIVDEVHMLSTAAFNALLKTLEEPPAHVIFILATTELQKLPATVISRCQRFEFRRIPTQDIAGRLKYVANAESITLEDDAALLIARKAQGGMRDALALLDTCSGGGKAVTVQNVNETAGSFGRETILKVAEAVANHDTDTILDAIDEAVRSSRDLLVYWQDLIDIWREMLMMRTTPNAKEYLDLTDSEDKAMKRVSSMFTKEQLLTHSEMLTNAYLNIQKANSIKRFTAEITLLKMSDLRLDDSPAALMARVAKLEDMIASGNMPVTSVKPEEPLPVSESQKKETPSKTEKTDDPPAAVEEEAPKAKAATVQDHPAHSAKAPAEVNRSEEKIKVLKKWPEIAEQLAELDPIGGGFLKTAKAYKHPNGTFEIKFTGEFGLMQIKSDTRMMNRIIQALSVQTGTGLTEDQLILGVQSQDDNPKAGIDEILDEE